MRGRDEENGGSGQGSGVTKETSECLALNPLLTSYMNSGMASRARDPCASVSPSAKWK